MPVLLPWAQNDRWERLLIDCIWESLQRWQIVSGVASTLTSLPEPFPQCKLHQKSAVHLYHSELLLYQKDSGSMKGLLKRLSKSSPEFQDRCQTAWGILLRPCLRCHPHNWQYKTAWLALLSAP